MQNISWAFIYNLNSIIKRICGKFAIRGQSSTGSSNETDLHFSSGFVHHVLALLLSYPFSPSPLALSQSICGKQQPARWISLYLMCQTACTRIWAAFPWNFPPASGAGFSPSPGLLRYPPPTAPMSRLAIMASKIKIAFLALCCKFFAANFVQKINEKY